MRRYLLLALALAGCPRPKQAPPTEYRVPLGFTGWAVVEFGVPGEPPLPTEGKVRIVAVPASGVVRTSTPLEDGSRHDTWIFLAPDGTRTTIKRAGEVSGPPYAEPVVGPPFVDSTHKASDGRTRMLEFVHFGRGVAGPKPEVP
jgi:hypothetical protein